MFYKCANDLTRIYSINKTVAFISPITVDNIDSIDSRDSIEKHSLYCGNFVSMYDFYFLPNYHFIGSSHATKQDHSYTHCSSILQRTFNGLFLPISLGSSNPHELRWVRQGGKYNCSSLNNL